MIILNSAKRQIYDTVHKYILTKSCPIKWVVFFGPMKCAGTYHPILYYKYQVFYRLLVKSHLCLVI